MSIKLHLNGQSIYFLLTMTLKETLQMLEKKEQNS